MSLTPEQCDALKAQLADAEKQYHSLITGTMARVVVDQNGQRVEFTAANRSTLGAYIASLQSQVSSCCGGAVSGALQALRPAMFIF